MRSKNATEVALESQVTKTRARPYVRHFIGSATNNSSDTIDFNSDMYATWDCNMAQSRSSSGGNSNRRRRRRRRGSAVAIAGATAGTNFHKMPTTNRLWLRTLLATVMLLSMEFAAGNTELLLRGMATAPLPANQTRTQSTAATTHTTAPTSAPTAAAITIEGAAAAAFVFASNHSTLTRGDGGESDAIIATQTVTASKAPEALVGASVATPAAARAEQHGAARPTSVAALIFSTLASASAAATATRLRDNETHPELLSVTEGHAIAAATEVQRATPLPGAFDDSSLAIDNMDAVQLVAENEVDAYQLEAVAAHAASAEDEVEEEEFVVQRLEEDTSDEDDDDVSNGNGTRFHPAPEILTKGFLIPTFLPPFPAFAMADLSSYTTASPPPTTTAAATTPLMLLEHYAWSGGGDQVQDQLYLAAYNKQHQRQATQLLQQRAESDDGNSSSSSDRRYLSVSATNVTVQMGNHAYMPCHIRRLTNKPISWVRVRDGHILSVDQTTFIADQRFQSIYKEDNEYTWSLQIKYVQSADDGWYECQVSTEPKMSAKVFLSVVVPTTELIGDQNRFVKAGSKVALHCIVRGTLDPPTYIIWFRGKTQITDDNKMGWFTQIDRNIFGNMSDNENTIGSLIIPFVRKVDSGNYTCQPSNAAAVSVDLHVLSGEYSASAIMSAASNYQLPQAKRLLAASLLLLAAIVTLLQHT